MTFIRQPWHASRRHTAGVRHNNHGEKKETNLSNNKTRAGTRFPLSKGLRQSSVFHQKCNSEQSAAPVTNSVGTREDPNRLVIKCLKEFVKGDRVVRHIHGEMFCLVMMSATLLTMRDDVLGAWE